VAGAVAYVVGLILTFLLLTIDGEYEFGDSPVLDAGTLDQVGWFFYSSHFANIEVSGSLFGQSETVTQNVVSESSLQLPDPVFYLVPIVILIAASYVVVASLDLWEPAPADCAQAGTTVVIGYLPLAVVGIFLFSASSGVSGADASVGPELATSVLLVGLLFPLLFGAVGGLLSSQTQ
jgi:predicted membrane channel-forming protein YqfA (hemolysin III family)